MTAARGVNVPPDEWENWATYYAAQFPGATKEFIEQMTQRMIRTLSYCGITRRMSHTDFNMRCRKTLEALRAIPDDAIQGGGDG